MTETKFAEGDTLRPRDAACIYLSCCGLSLPVWTRAVECHGGVWNMSDRATPLRTEESRAFLGTEPGATHAMAIHIDFSDTRQEGLTRHPLCAAPPPS